VSRSAALGADLDVWLTPFLEVMGRSTRRRWGPLYVRGLLGPDGPKSVQPIAARLGLSGHDQLHHFVSSPAWDDAPLWRVLAERADRLVGGADAVLVIDDTSVPKRGTLSVGVAPQYCGELGKQASCQALVSLTLARHEVPVGLRLFLPKAWTAPLRGCGGPRSGARPADQARDRAGRDRPRDRRGRALRLRAGRRRLRLQRALQTRAERARPGLVGRRPAHPEGLHDRRQADLAERRSRPTAQAARSERACQGRRLGAGRLPLAPHRLAPGRQGRARPLRWLSTGQPRPGGRGR
jgi:hypothetical protein